MSKANSKLRSWLGANQITGKEFAKMIDMPYDTFKSKITNRSDWRLADVIKILAVTGCKFEELF